MPALRKYRTSLARAALCVGLVASGHASAHEQDADVARVRVSGETVYIVATPSVRAWSEFDDDHNGLLAKEEVARHRESLMAAFEQAFRTDAARADGSPDPGTKAAVFRDVSTPHAHDSSQLSGAEHLRFTFRYRLARPPTALRVQWDRSHLAELTVVAQRMSESMRIAEQRPLTRAESVLLTPQRPGHVFFLENAPRAAATAPPQEHAHDHETHAHEPGHDHAQGHDHPHAADRHDGAFAKLLWVVTLVAALGAGLAFALFRARRKQ
jgi:hypothetical protein